MATLLKATGEQISIVGSDPTSAEIPLADLQCLVGGYIELVRLDGGRFLCCNEDAKNGPHIKNNAATLMVRDWLAEWDYIAGDALVLEPGEVR